ncbi:oligosaccharide repeat unit polymerase [Motilimonas pumila]|uniref:Oligosaccharide repeat unit polymerase n=2 Tax=Motilimonas pumila TaxID=2303987 RepID=A0A418YD80_9GAMM|nr:oligosaccharide repeat unit polymerase [Motilimonas pumila]
MTQAFLPGYMSLVIISALPLAGLVLVKYSFVMVFLFVGFSFFRLHEAFSQLYHFKIPLLLSLAALLGLGWQLLISRQIKCYWRAEMSWLLAFYLVVMVGIVLASNRPIALAYFNNIYWKIILMSFAIAWLMQRKQDFSSAIFIIVGFGTAIACVAIYNQVNAIGLVEGTRVTIGRQLGSVLGDPNDLALVLMFPMAFACAIAFHPKVTPFLRLGLCGCVILLSVAIIATQSRGGLLGILAIFSLFFYFKCPSKTLFLTVFTLLAPVLFVIAGISDRASGGAAEAGIDASAMGRLYAWQAAWGMALDNPLSGVGLNNFYANYYFYSPHWDGLNHAVHSTWFGILAETGFLGLLIFTGLMLKLIRCGQYNLSALRNTQHTVPLVIDISCRAVFVALIATVISATFLTQGFTWPIYVLAAMVIALRQWIDKHL